MIGGIFHISVKDFKAILKPDTKLIVNLGSDENNFARLVMYREEKHGDLIIDNIYIVDKDCVGVDIL